MVVIGSALKENKSEKRLFPKPENIDVDDDEYDQYCSLCDEQARLERHHVSYYPEKTILICKSCHVKIHHEDSFHPELKPPKDDAAIYYGRKEPTSILTINLELVNSPKIEFLGIQSKLGLTDNSETIRFLIHQYYKHIKLDEEWWE